MAQEEIIFKVGVDTGTAKSDIDKVGDSVENVGKETKKTAGSFTSLRKELKNLTIQLQNLDPASKEFEKVAQRAGQIKEQMRGVADAINDADPEVFGGKFQRTAEGIAGAFSAVTGAQALFGQQSEEIEKQMLKVQGAIALTQGISAMKELKNDALDLATSIKTKVIGAVTSLTGAELANAEATGTMTTLQKIYTTVVGTSTGALKAFKIALATTGIGLLVVGLGLLISKMMDYFKSTEEIIKQNERLFNSNNKIIAQIGKRREKIDEDMNKQLAYAEAMGKSDEDLYNIKKKFSDKSIKANNDEIQTRLDNVKKLKAIDLGVQASSKEQYLELVKTNKQKIVAEWERINELKKINSKANDDVKIAQIKLNNENKEEQKKANEEASKTRKEEYKRQLDEKNQNRLKQIEIENQRIQEQEALENEYYDSLKTQQQLEEQAVRDKYNKIIETTTDNETLKLARQKELDAIAQKYKDENDKQENERQNNIAQQYEDFVNQYSDATTDSFQKEKNAVNEKYYYLIKKAEEYGFSTIELQKKQADEIKAINEKQAEEEKQLRDKKIEDVKQAYTDITSAIATSQGVDLKNIQDKHAKELEYLKDNFSNKSNYADLEYGLKLKQYNEENVIVERQKKLAEIQKKIAIFQTTIDTAQSLASTIKGATTAAAAGGPAAPFLLTGYIAAGVATVMKSFATVKSLLNAPMPSITPPKMPRSDNQGTGDNNGNTGTQTEIQAQSTYKVVVVDSDITKMQEKTKKTELISTI